MGCAQRWRCRMRLDESNNFQHLNNTTLNVTRIVHLQIIFVWWIWFLFFYSEMSSLWTQFIVAIWKCYQKFLSSSMTIFISHINCGSFKKIKSSYFFTIWFLSSILFYEINHNQDFSDLLKKVLFPNIFEENKKKVVFDKNARLFRVFGQLDQSVYW